MRSPGQECWMRRERGLRPSPEHLLHVHENLAQQMVAKQQGEGIVRTAGPLKLGEGGR